MDEAPGAGLAANRAEAASGVEEAVAASEQTLKDPIQVSVRIADDAGAGTEPAKWARQTSDEDLGTSTWNIDGSRGHYHSAASLCLVMWAQILYMISLVIIIPTAKGYAASLGNPSTIYFGVIVGISSITTPVVSRLWTSVIKLTSLNAVLQMNALINLACSLMYVLANYFGGDVLLLVSRCLLGFGSVQTASLRYLGCAVSTKKVKFAHFLTTAALSYGFAFGAFLAFLLSLAASYRGWNQHTLPGWFTAFLWLAYLPLHKLLFREPDEQAATVGPESRIRLNREMKPRRRREPFKGLIPCFVAIFVVAVVKGAFEILTIEITRDLWQWEVMQSALYLGAVMLVVAMTTLLSCRLERHLGEGRIFVGGLVCASLLLPFYYIPLAIPFHDQMGTALGMAIYLTVSILALSALNLGRTMAFSLTTELPSPLWRNYFLSAASEIFTVGRGVGPILAGAWDKNNVVTMLIIGCVVAAACVKLAWSRGHLEHDEHELGPASAEQTGGDDWDDFESWVHTVDAWFGRTGVEGQSANVQKCSTGDGRLDPSQAGSVPADLESGVGCTLPAELDAVDPWLGPVTSELLVFGDAVALERPAHAQTESAQA